MTPIPRIGFFYNNKGSSSYFGIKMVISYCCKYPVSIVYDYYVCDHCGRGCDTLIGNPRMEMQHDTGYVRKTETLPDTS